MISLDEIPCDSYFDKGSYTPNPRIESAERYIRDLYSQVELKRRRSVRDTVYGVRVLPKANVEMRLKNLFHPFFAQEKLCHLSVPATHLSGRPRPRASHRTPRGTRSTHCSTSNRPGRSAQSAAPLDVGPAPSTSYGGKAAPKRPACGRRRPSRPPSGRPSSLMYVFEARADRQSTGRPPPGAVDVDSTCSSEPRRPYPAMAHLAPPLAHHPDAPQPGLPYVPTH